MKLTPKQERLKKRHGTPKEFSNACWNALDMISHQEAQSAIWKYSEEWKRAGTPK